MPVSDIPHVRIALLGLTTIVAYGTWYYAYGVLLDPIILDTGWSETGMAATFTAGGIVVGVGALGGGWLLDRLGSRRVFLAAALVGGGALWLTSLASSLGQFALGGTVGSGALGALAFYHVTQTTAVRIAPRAPAKAIARLTIWGALASPLYLPVTAFMIERYDWRVVIRILVVPVIVVLVATAFFVHAPAPDTRARRAIRSVLRATAVAPERRRFVVASALAGMSMSIVLVYQVPVMTSLGLPLTVAASVAALRGLAQLLGRLPLTPILRWLGVRRSYQLALLAIIIGFGLLMLSGSLAAAIAFALVAGFGIGANSPLQGIYTAELYEREVLGSAMGFTTMVYAAVGALGPAIVGALADATGSRLWAVAVGAAASLLSILVIGISPQHQADASTAH